jgi:hypothetical protein
MAVFVIEGDVVVLRLGGASDFDALHSRKHDKRASRATWALRGLSQSTLIAPTAPTDAGIESRSIIPHTRLTAGSGTPAFAECRSRCAMLKLSKVLRLFCAP